MAGRETELSFSPREVNESARARARAIFDDIKGDLTESVPREELDLPPLEWERGKGSVRLRGGAHIIRWDALRGGVS